LPDAIAAAAAIAAGVVNVQNIQAQRFNPGGQADSGMDAIPQSLGGKSFVLSAGERVVQPEGVIFITVPTITDQHSEEEIKKNEKNVPINQRSYRERETISDDIEVFKIAGSRIIDRKPWLLDLTRSPQA
jgi:hypothetical protein